MPIEAEPGMPSETGDAFAQEPAEPPVVLRACGLKRAFENVCAVYGLDLSVREGEIYGFLGANGADKTTAIRLLMGIIKPDEGTIELLGERTRRTTIRQKRSIGYVSQEQTLFLVHGTIAGNRRSIAFVQAAFFIFASRSAGTGIVSSRLRGCAHGLWDRFPERFTHYFALRFAPSQKRSCIMTAFKQPP
jgi:ABC-type Fe3+/spermidine/putrescine transport system ATPase subunit